MSLYTIFAADLFNTFSLAFSVDRASLRCCYSFFRSSGPVQTVLTLWLRVPMTLYLAARLWWLSHCTYWSVWLGFLYTEIDRELSASGLTKISRNGIAPFSWLPSTVNFIAGSTWLMWFRNNCLWASCWMTKVSSTNLNQYLGWGGSTKSFSLKVLHIQVGSYRAYWGTHAYTLNLFTELILKRKLCIMQTEPQYFNYVLYW